VSSLGGLLSAGDLPQDSPHLSWHKSLEEAAAKAAALSEAQKSKVDGSISKLQQDSIDHLAVSSKFSATVRLIPHSTATACLS
jgi:hypothetical protein